MEKKNYKTVICSDWTETMVWRNQDKLDAIHIVDEWVDDFGNIHIMFSY